jgi:hypothetical protein
LSPDDEEGGKSEKGDARIIDNAAGRTTTDDEEDDGVTTKRPTEEEGNLLAIRLNIVFIYDDGDGLYVRGRDVGVRRNNAYWGGRWAETSGFVVRD